MDICVIGFNEVSGPLGGISVEYQIKVYADSKRPEFLNSFQNETDDIVSFTVNKTFKEIEYFHKKIKAKYSGIQEIPCLVADNSPFVENKQMRMKTANNFLNFVAKDKVLGSSNLLFSFLGYDPDKKTDENSSFARVTMPELTKPTAKILPTTTTVENKSNVCTSDVFFSEKEETDEVDEEEEEDLFQEFTRQNTIAAATQLSKPSSSLFIDSPLKSQSSNRSGQFADLFAFEKEGKNLVSDETKDKTNKLEELMDSAELLTIDDSLSDIWKEMQEKHSKPKPEVKPKPLLAPKPSLPQKHPLPTTSNQDKPVPAPRTKPVPAPRLPEASAAASGKISKGKDPEAAAAGDKGEKVLELSVMKKKDVSKESDSKDLSAFDILSYIDSEQQAQNQGSDNLDLFA